MFGLHHLHSNRQDEWAIKIDDSYRLIFSLCDDDGNVIKDKDCVQIATTIKILLIKEVSKHYVFSFSTSNVIDVANYIINKYKEIIEEDETLNFKSTINSLKLQKLLYFTQRECLSLIGNVAFKENLEGWKFGPVSPTVYHIYNSKKIN